MIQPLIWEVICRKRGTLALGFALTVINRLTGLVIPYSTKFLVDRVILAHELTLIRVLISAVLVATAIQALTSFALGNFVSRGAEQLIAELRQRVHAHVTRLPVAFHDSSRTGILVSRIMNDIEGVRNLVGAGLVELAGGIITAITTLILLWHISRALTIPAFGFLLCVAIGIQKAMAAIQPIYLERSRLNAEVIGRLSESLDGVRVVKCYRAEEREEKVFTKGIQAVLSKVIVALRSSSLMNVSTSVLLGVQGAVIMLMGVNQIISGSLTIGGLFTYMLFLGFLKAPIVQVAFFSTQLSEVFAGLERTSEILGEPLEDQNPKRTMQLGRINGLVRFENVSFGYDRDRTVLHNLSFESAPGSVTALVGPTGSGKSTTTSLISAFYAPTAGRILVDDHDLSTIRLDCYRTQLGVVLQEAFLFDDTIRENIAFSRPGATEQEVLQAGRIAGVEQFACGLRNGYDTVVGERGAKLSGGQRQCISIARAILREPRILILDEASSSLDANTEALVQQGLSYLMRGRTTFVIAHRLSTILGADQILVLDQGRIVERGTHGQLYARQRTYYALYTRQYGLDVRPPDSYNLCADRCESNPIEKAKYQT